MTTNRTHGNVHEITVVGTTNLTHDVKGNLTTNVSGNTYTWDFDNQLAGANTDGQTGDDVTFSYDALNRRVIKDNGSTIVVFAIAQQRVVSEYISGTAPTAPAEKFFYAAFMDEPIQKTGTGGNVYYHRNSQYSVSSLTDTNGIVVERYAYSAYEQPLLFAGNGTTSRTTSNFNNWYTYTGRRLDGETKLYFYRLRYFDCELGRFLSRDPVSYFDANNLYLSMRSKPTGLIDPTGLASCKVNWQGPCTVKNFVDWYTKELGELQEWLKKVKPCPCSLACTGTFYVPKTSRSGPTTWSTICRDYKICPIAPDGFTFIEPSDAFGYHPGTAYEIRENTCDDDGCNPGSQCTYDDSGNLITKIPSAGTVDRYSGGCGKLWNANHRDGDVLPADCAEKLSKESGTQVFLDYIEKVRPTNSGEKCSEAKISICKTCSEAQIPKPIHQ